MSWIDPSRLPTILDCELDDDKPAARFYSACMKTEKWGDPLWLTARSYQFEHLGRTEVGDVVLAFPGILERLFNCVLPDNLVNGRLPRDYDFFDLGGEPREQFHREEVMAPGRVILSAGVEVQIVPDIEPERNVYTFNVKTRGGALVILTQSEQESIPDEHIPRLRTYVESHFKGWKDYAKTQTRDTNSEVVVIRSVVRAARWASFIFPNTGIFSVTIGTMDKVYTYVKIHKESEGQFMHRNDCNTLEIMNHIHFYKAIRMTRTAGAFFSLKAQAEPQNLDRYNPGSGSVVLAAGPTTDEPEISPSISSAALAATLRESALSFSQIKKRYMAKLELSPMLQVRSLVWNMPEGTCAHSDHTNCRYCRRAPTTMLCPTGKVPWLQAQMKPSASDILAQ